MKNFTSAQWIGALVALALTVASLGAMLSFQSKLEKSAAEGRAKRVAAQADL